MQANLSPDFDPAYGQMIRITPKVRRIVANNPGPFTGPGTGTYIVGNEEVAVIDPGPMMPDHVNAILAGLGDETVSHIIVTHTHSDHSPAAALLKQHTNAPIFAFALHAEASAGALEGGVDRKFKLDFQIEDGEIINGHNWSLEAIHTPGHCSNHLCFAFNSENALFCGDQLMSWSTTVILPPDGNIADYIASLEHLSTRSEKTYYPTHGAAITDPKKQIKETIEHRLQRIEQVKAAIGAGTHTLSALREQIYTKIPDSLFAGAELSLIGSIDYLIDQGTVIKIENNAQSEFRLTKLSR